MTQLRIVRLAFLAAFLAGAAADAAEPPAVVWDLQIDGPVPIADAYAAVGAAWECDVVVAEGLEPVEVRVDFQRVTRDEALDLLTKAVGHFWWVDGEGTVHVDLDTPANRADHEPMVRRSFPLRTASAEEVATALRSLISARHLEIDDEGVHVELAAPRMPWAERVVAAMEGAAPAPGPPAGPFVWFGPWGTPDPALGSEPPRRLWFPRPTPRERLHQAIEARFGVDVVLDPAIVDPGRGTLRLEAATLFEALDALTVPAGRFWTLLGGRRILVAADTLTRRGQWEPIGLAAFPLRHAHPAAVRQALRDLGVRATAYGSRPPVVLARSRPAELAMVRFVVEAADRHEPVAAAGDAGSRLWLGTQGRPRMAEAQLYVDPATAGERRLTLAAAEPPRLAPVPPSHLAALASGEAGRLPVWRAKDSPPQERYPSLPWMLEEELGLHVGLDTCHWPTPPRRIAAAPPAERDRDTVLRALAEEHALRWTVLGPDTVLLAPEAPNPRKLNAQRGIAAVRAVAGLRAAKGLDLEAQALLVGPRSLLLAVGRWEELEKLLAAAAAVPDPALRQAQGSSE